MRYRHHVGIPAGKYMVLPGAFPAAPWHTKDWDAWELWLLQRERAMLWHTYVDLSKSGCARATAAQQVLRARRIRHGRVGAGCVMLWVHALLGSTPGLRATRDAQALAARLQSWDRYQLTVDDAG